MNGFDAPFIKSRTPFDNSAHAPFPAPIFRRRFTLDKIDHAILTFCALGYGYCYINGKEVTKDLFCAPASEYDKLVWYHQYQVSDLLKTGENVIAVILGNAFFNENFPSVWEHHKAAWRDNPKFALSLSVDGQTVLESDEEFRYTEESFVIYNQLRSGETFDARLYHKNWKELEFDDSSFLTPVIDHKLDGAKRELCCCEPIREFEEYDFISAQKTDVGYLLDFGVNIAGYLRVCVQEDSGTVIEMKHAEEAYEDGSLKLNGLDIFYPTADFQADRYICGEKPYAWSPKFTYHGFRFVQVKGLTKPPKKGEFKAVFVHQAVEKIADFSCSDELINKIYHAGIRATYSNLHYVLTDCPTREKLGWTNDAQSSFEQMYINFNIKAFMEKWGTDMLVSMNKEGAMPAVVPSHGYGFHLGPVADGILFELPLIEYLYLGDAKKLIRFLPYLKRYYDNYYTSETIDRSRWLGDWDGLKNRFDDTNFVSCFYTIKFCDVLMLAQSLAGEEVSEKYKADKAAAQNAIRSTYILENGYSSVDSQTVISMLLFLDISDKAPLLEQMKKRIEADDYHLTSGMLGLQYVYRVLFENGLGEYAYKLITAKGQPSFSYWFENGATTLWETWEDTNRTDSRNHHMLSGVLAWFFKGFLGLSPNLANPGYQKIELKPCFAKEMEHCKGSVTTPYGQICVGWERKQGQIEYHITIPAGVTATFQNAVLVTGENKFIIKEETV